MTRLAVISGGVGQPSTTRLLADRLAEAVRAQLTDRDEVVTTVVEVRELATDVAQASVNGVESTALRTAKENVAGADALIIVSPVFNAGIAGLVKSFLDLFSTDDLAGMPVLLAATGGTVRHSLVIDHALRPIASYLRMWAAPTGVFLATEEWGAGSTGRESGNDPAARIAQAAGELAELVVRAPRRQRRDPYDDVVPFSRLLGR